MKIRENNAAIRVTYICLCGICGVHVSRGVLRLLSENAERLLNLPFHTSAVVSSRIGVCSLCVREMRYELMSFLVSPPAFRSVYPL